MEPAPTRSKTVLHPKKGNSVQNILARWKEQWQNHIPSCSAKQPEGTGDGGSAQFNSQKES